MLLALSGPFLLSSRVVAPLGPFSLPCPRRLLPPLLSGAIVVDSVYIYIVSKKQKETKKRRLTYGPRDCHRQSLGPFSLPCPCLPCPLLLLLLLSFSLLVPPPLVVALLLLLLLL